MKTSLCGTDNDGNELYVYTLVFEPNCKAMAFLSLDEDYQERLLYDVKERSMRSMLRIERAAAKHYSFLCKDVPVSSFREQSLKVQR